MSKMKKKSSHEDMVVLTTSHDTEIFHNHLSVFFRFYDVKVVTTARNSTLAVSNSFLFPSRHTKAR